MSLRELIGVALIVAGALWFGVWLFLTGFLYGRGTRSGCSCE